MSEKEKVVVTGGAGFIGSNLVDALVTKEYEVHVVDTLVAGSREHVNPLATLHEVDIRDGEKLKTIFTGASCVFHLAALPRVQYSLEYPLETHDVNVSGTLSVLESARTSGVKKIVYSASSSAYGDQTVMPLQEAMIASPKSPYGLQKYLGELYCRLYSEVYGLSTISLRYFNVYGPRQSSVGAYALVIAKFLEQRKAGKAMTITGDGTQTRDFTHVRDVVAANFAAFKKEGVAGEVFNIGSGRNFSVKHIAKLIGGQIEYVPARLEPHDTLADISKARAELGWEPKMIFEEGIAELKKELQLS